MFKNGIGMMFIIMISRLLGFVRAFAIAYYFGATNITDAYYSAFKISNFLISKIDNIVYFFIF